VSAPSSSSPRLHEELVEHVRGKRALFVVGTGVSLGATGMAPTASWTGLIDDGLGYCAELDPARKGWAERYKAALQNVLGGATELIAIASMVEQMLGGGDRRGGTWSGWLGKTLGRLNVTDRSVVDQLHTLGQGRLATCNYDDVLTADNYPPVTWKHAASITQVLSGEASGVVHLHGHWSTPDSVALGFSSYAALLNDEAAQSLQRSMASLSSLVFVGFGAGLEDPNFGALLRWVSKTFAERQAHHFWLVKDGDVESANRAVPDGSRVIVLGYGPRHSDLHGFLLDLADRAGLNDKPIEDEDFVGRIAEIKAFKERLAKWLREPPLPWCVAIDGLGGAGKTSLAQMLLEETEASSVQSVRILKNTIMKISESRQVAKLQLELAQAVSEVTHVPFARFNKALKTRAKSIERSSAWHEDLRGALDGKRLAIFLDDYERICRYPRSDPAQPRDDTLEEEDEGRPFCHDWVSDAIVRSAPLGVCWILAGRGSSGLELPKEGTQVFRLRGLERGAVFKLVKGSGSMDPQRVMRLQFA
jgi:SIR2-like domain